MSLNKHPQNTFQTLFESSNFKQIDSLQYGLWNTKPLTYYQEKWLSFVCLWLCNFWSLFYATGQDTMPCNAVLLGGINSPCIEQ